jgi:hypothetical protein
LEYCCPIWSPFYAVHFRLEGVQKKCLSFLSRKFNYGRSLTSYSLVLELCLWDRRKRYDLLCLHKILHSSIDAPDLLSLFSINTLYRSRQPNIFTSQVYRNNISYYNPIVRMSRLYNEVARDNATIDVFNSKFSLFKRNVSDLFKPGSKDN